MPPYRQFSNYLLMINKLCELELRTLKLILVQDTHITLLTWLLISILRPFYFC